jgi:Fuc2NAc and GlcNAc transferase
MNHFTWLIFPFLLVLLSICFTKVIIIFSQKNNIQSEVNQRSSHFNPISSGGGLSFIFITIIALFSFSFLDYFYVEQFYYFIFSSLLISFIGYWDDVKNISPLIRFIFQLLASVIIIFLFIGFPEIEVFSISLLPDSIRLIFGVIFLIWLTNLYNFMDGIDGIATIQGIFILLSYLILFLIFEPVNSSDDLAKFFTLSIIILTASLFGFLFYNFPSASIFMGDVGSSFLGFFLGTLGIFAAVNNWITFWTLLIIWSIFINDSTITLLVRIYNKEKWYQAHRSHTYQKLTTYIFNNIKEQHEKEISRTKAHRVVCGIFLLTNIFWVLPLSIISIKYYEYGFIINLVCFFPLIITSIIAGAGKRD